jgi:hypothetical protein
MNEQIATRRPSRFIRSLGRSSSLNFNFLIAVIGQRLFMAVMAGVQSIEIVATLPTYNQQP